MSFDRPLLRFGPPGPVYGTLEMLTGTEGADLLVGSEADDKIAGAGGDDLLIGGGGMDEIAGESLDETVNGTGRDIEAGDDRVFLTGHWGRASGDFTDLWLHAGADDRTDVRLGNDRIEGDGDTLRLIGDVSHALLRGAEGAELIVLTAGDDEILSSGNDGLLVGDIRFLYAEGDGSEVIALLGNDTLRGGGILCGDTNSAHIYAESPGSSVMVTAGDDVLEGGAGNDSLYGDSASLWMSIDVPGQTLASFCSGNDTLMGGEGDDRLTGDVGTFVIGHSAPPSYDSPPPGIGFTPGADTFVFAGDFGYDIVTDFQRDLDFLLFEGFAVDTFDALVLTQYQNGLEVAVYDQVTGGGGFVLLLGVYDLDASDVAFA